MSEMRLNKYLSENGYCSRREADRLIESGSVFVNNRVAKLGDKVTDSDVVRVHGRNRSVRTPEYTYLLMHKPVGAVVSARARGAHHVLSMLHTDAHIQPIGTMDTRHEGLVLFTDDPILLQRAERIFSTAPQEFVIESDREIPRSIIAQLQNGVSLPGGMAPAMQVRRMDEYRFAIILPKNDPGLLHKLAEHLGFFPVRIIRTRLFGVKLISTTPVGHARHLTGSELRELQLAVDPTKQRTAKSHHKK